MDMSATQEIIDLEKEYVLGVYGRPPFVFSHGEGATLYDTEGKAYLDCVSGIAVNALGYGGCRDEDRPAGSHGQRGSTTSAICTTRLPTRGWAQMLCTHSFADKVHFCLTGADANEGAFKFARRYAYEMDVDDKVLHPGLLGCFPRSPVRQSGRDSAVQVPGPFPALDARWVRFANYNDLDSARSYMDERICAIIVEPLQGEGGVNSGHTRVSARTAGDGRHGGCVAHLRRSAGAAWGAQGICGGINPLWGMMCRRTS